MKMGGSLTGKITIGNATLFGGPISLKALLYDGRIFSMIIGMHLYVTRTDVHFITIGLQAMVMRLLAIMLTLVRQRRHRRRRPRHAITTDAGGIVLH